MSWHRQHCGNLPSCFHKENNTQQNEQKRGLLLVTTLDRINPPYFAVKGRLSQLAPGSQWEEHKEFMLVALYANSRLSKLCIASKLRNFSGEFIIT